MKRSLHFGGRAVSLHFKGPVSHALVDFMFSNVPAHGPARAHITFSLEDVGGSDDLVFSAPVLKNSESHPGYLGSGVVRGPANQVVSRLLYEVDYHLADRCHSGLYLHAACLARKGQALLLPAASGSGKSTLTYWLTQNGYNYLSDESSYIPLYSQDVIGFTRPAHLKKNSLALFPKLETVPTQPVHWTDGSLLGWLIGTGALNPLPVENFVPIQSIIFPNYRAGSMLSYERLSPARTAFELAGCLTNARNLPEHGFPEIMRLARVLPAWRLSYSNFSQVADALSL
jgi:hypothetical protein